MGYAYKNLLEPKNQASGIAEFALLAPVSWFAADGIKSPVAPFTNPGDEITISTAHVFLDTKGFVKYQLAPQKNSLSINTRGDIGLNGQNSEVKIFLPGSYAQAHESVKNLLNTPLIVLAKDSNCDANLFHQLGCDCQYAWLTANFSTGTTKDGVKGYEATITYDGGALFYSAAIEYVDEAPSCPILVLDNTTTTLSATWAATSGSNGHEAKLFSNAAGTVQVGATQNLAAGTNTVTFTTLTADTTYYLKVSPKNSSGVVTSGCTLHGIKTDAA